MKLFIDTNIYLSFYHYSSDDLEELHKLAVLVANKRITLLLPEQVEDEFHRNREDKIVDALKKFNEERLNNQFPQICKEYEEYELMRKAINNFQKSKDILLKKIKDDISSFQLKADKLIVELFYDAKKLKITNEILASAKHRQKLGNPPGKKGSYGDAINWECIQREIEVEEDLYIVSDDRDYYSKIDNDCLSKFLIREWEKSKRGEIHYFRKLSALFHHHFPDITLATELEKDLLIDDLIESNTFANTRRTLRKLVKFNEFTPAQLNEIANAAINNNQIYLIIGDQDIEDYLTQIIFRKEEQIEPDVLLKFKEILKAEHDRKKDAEISLDDSL